MLKIIKVAAKIRGRREAFLDLQLAEKLLELDYRSQKCFQTLVEMMSQFKSWIWIIGLLI